jgi:phage terminase small subunit
MSRLGHLTEHRKHFVEAYCRLGNGTLAAKEAGYKDSPSLVNKASKLKRELSHGERIQCKRCENETNYFM